MKKSKYVKRLAVSIMAAMLLLGLYCVIFLFSGQDGDTSGGISHKISENCIELIYSLSGGGWTDDFRTALAEYVEHPIRKMAHLTEYACMGVLVYIMLRPWRKRDKKLYLTVILWVMVSASGDELHQLFVPGRCGSMKDVLLDTVGGCAGLIACVLVEKMRIHFKGKNKRTISRAL